MNNCLQSDVFNIRLKKKGKVYMMKKIVVFGGVGTGMTIASIIEHDPNAELMGFLNDAEEKGTMVGEFKKFPVVGKFSDVTELLKDPDVYFTFAQTAMQKGKQRLELIDSMSIPSERFYSAIHPQAIVPKGFCRLGNGVVLYANAQVGVDAVMEDNSMCFANTYLGHNSVLERFAHLTAGSVVGAHVHVGKFVHIGLNALVKEHVTIGDYSLIGAGAVVLKDVPANCIVVGNPAKVLRYIE